MIFFNLNKLKKTNRMEALRLNFNNGFPELEEILPFHLAAIVSNYVLCDFSILNNNCSFKLNGDKIVSTDPSGSLKIYSMDGKLIFEPNESISSVMITNERGFLSRKDRMIQFIGYQGIKTSQDFECLPRKIIANNTHFALFFDSITCFIDELGRLYIRKKNEYERMWSKGDFFVIVEGNESRPTVNILKGIDSIYKKSFRKSLYHQFFGESSEPFFCFFLSEDSSIFVINCITLEELVVPVISKENLIFVDVSAIASFPTKLPFMRQYVVDDYRFHFQKELILENGTYKIKEDGNTILELPSNYRCENVLGSDWFVFSDSKTTRFVR